MDNENPETQDEISPNPQDGAAVPAEELSPETPPAAPKRRGRPPKNPDAPAAPKRPRGRPRKTAVESADVPAQDDSAAAVPAEGGETPAAPVPAEADFSAAPAREEPVAAPAPVPAAPKSFFSFDPDDEIAPPAPAERTESAEEIAPPAAESLPAPAPGSVSPAAPAPAAAGEGSAPAAAKPWEKKDRPWKQKPWEKKDRPPFPPKPPKFSGGKFSAQGKFEKFRGNDKFAPKRNWGELANTDSAEEASLSLGAVFDYGLLSDEAYLDELAQLALHVAKRADGASPFVARLAAPAVPAEGGEAPAESVPAKAELAADVPAAPLDFNEIYESSMSALISSAKAFGIPVFRNPVRRPLVKKILRAAFAENRPISIRGTLELLADGNGLLLYACDSYRVKELSAFVPQALISKFGLQRGHDVEAVAFPPMKGETAPIVVRVTSVMGGDPAEVKDLTPFTELTPYYPTERIMLETDDGVPWNNLSMRCVDLLCPIGLGQRGLIVAPPRTGKTVLLQAIANAIAKNCPNAHLIVLLVDERPEEVTDFKRKTTRGEVISSTFDETAENHVHVAEMVIERARRMVERGKDVIILLDSITRLARAYNTLMPNGGKILSGGVEAGALSKPKRFFGSARNIEGGGSLTILGTALVDTGSKMDEVIFEEFKGTGNMELDLDRDLANKRIYPAINFERSGTRKEEQLYHPQEMQCVYSMRRAMKGVPSIEAMEMLISRMKKTKTNAEFLITLAGR